MVTIKCSQSVAKVLRGHPIYTFLETFAKATFQTCSNQSQGVSSNVLTLEYGCITLQPFPFAIAGVRVTVTSGRRSRIDDAALVHALSPAFASALAHACVVALVLAFAIVLAIAVARS